MRQIEAISIHAPRTGSDNMSNKIEKTHEISIHAPRTGSDSRHTRLVRHTRHFNPRSPHGERQRFGSLPSWRTLFQSTLPARGATTHLTNFLHRNMIFQSTLPARGATRILLVGQDAELISIHAPRTGSDLNCDDDTIRFQSFQSTLPARGATGSTSSPVAT